MGRHDLLRVPATVSDRGAGPRRQVQPDPDAGHLHAVAGRPGAATKVDYTLETDPRSAVSDRLLEIVGGRSWNRRKAAKAMRRLRTILEENRGRGERATIEAR